MPGSRRLFTREEAEQLLTEVDRLLGLAQELLRRIPEGRRRPTVGEMLHERRNGHAHGQPTPAARSARAEDTAEEDLAQVLAHLERLGILVKDVREGVVDFPSEREGREVYLCWRRGEPPRLRWWHEVDTGFASRQPLD